MTEELERLQTALVKIRDAGCTNCSAYHIAVEALGSDGAGHDHPRITYSATCEACHKVEADR